MISCICFLEGWGCLNAIEILFGIWEKHIYLLLIRGYNDMELANSYHFAKMLTVVEGRFNL